MIGLLERKLGREEAGIEWYRKELRIREELQVGGGSSAAASIGIVAGRGCRRTPLWTMVWQGWPARHLVTP